MEQQTKRSYHYLTYLKTLIPKALPKINDIIYLGIGSDVWVPFGMFGATKVIAYDRIDPLFLLAPGKTKTQQLYAYAVTLISPLQSMEVENLTWTVNPHDSRVVIRFEYNGKRCTLTLYIQDVRQVKLYPKADLIFDSIGATKGLKKRIIAQSQATYYMTHDDGKDTIPFCYPSDLRQFSDEYTLMYLLNTQLKSAKAKTENWCAFDKYTSVICEPMLISKLRDL